MERVAYRARVTLTRQQGPARVAKMPAGEEVAFGVHGAVARHYGVSMEALTSTSTTLDYIVAAAAG